MTGWRVGWMVVPEALVRPVERLQQTSAISVPTLSQIAAAAAFDGRAEMDGVKHGYEENRTHPRRRAAEGRNRQVPACGWAFYLYADVSQLHRRQLELSHKRMLDAGGVAATSGIDFDPVRWQALHAVSPMRARPTTCARRWTKSRRWLRREWNRA